MRQLLFLLVLSLPTTASVLAQTRITITGRVSDIASGRGIPYASIQLQNGSAGTTTNADGNFVFKANALDLRDSLMITCMGYKAMKTLAHATERVLDIRLSPAIIELAAVTVKAQTGLDIIKSALLRIPENYDTSDTRYTAFYREQIALDTFDLTYVETVLDIFRPSVAQKTLNDQIKILKGRKKKIDYGKEAQLYYWLGSISNGVRGSLSEDLIKYRNARYSPLNPANFENYEYEYIETIRDDVRNIIVIDIVPKPRARKGYLRTRVYLDEQSLAIIRYNFELTEKGVQFVSRKDKGVAYAIMTNVVHATTDYKKFQYSINYTQHHGKWYLHRITRHWEIAVNSKRRNWDNKPWRADMDLLITDIRMDSIHPISTGDIGQSEKSMVSLMGSDFDENFWGDYNTIKADKEKPARSSAVILPSENTTSSPSTFSNRQNGFTRADTLRGALTPLRTCYDVTFYHLDIDVDLQRRSIKGSNKIHFAVTEPFSRMQIDLYDQMKIDSIVHKNKLLSYQRELNAVFIDFPKKFNTGDQSEIIIYYEGIPQVPDRQIPMHGGILWGKDSLGNDWVQVVCQGSGASLWWPNKDHQSDEPDSMKIWVTIPSHYTEISNGRLLRKTPMHGNRTRYEWLVTYPINNYNVTFNIGKYAHFSDTFISDDSLTIDYYVMEYNVSRAKKLFKQVNPMLNTFERYFGKYPFPKDGFTIVESLYPMEHQSGVCIGKITPDTPLDAHPLLWHESAHEWWGNAITVKDVADMWIHEAFATYAEILIAEDWYGKTEAAVEILDQADAVLGKEPITGVYNVNHIHYEIRDMYSKGSLMLHTFRQVLNNDTLWFTLLRDIQKNFRYKTLTADELIRFINHRTGSDYSYFFDQYLHYTEIPTLQIKVRSQGKDLIIDFRWEANVNNFHMPVRITTSTEKYSLLTPTSKWQKLRISNMSAEVFDVDDENFYIRIERK